MYNEGRTMLFCNSTQEVERILKYQNPGTFVIYIPKDKRNRLCVSAVAKNNPVSYVTNEWNATTVTEAEVLKFIVNNHLRVYYIHPSKRDNILWGIANIV